MQGWDGEMELTGVALWMHLRGHEKDWQYTGHKKTIRQQVIPGHGEDCLGKESNIYIYKLIVNSSLHLRPRLPLPPHPRLPLHLRRHKWHCSFAKSDKYCPRQCCT